MNWRSILRTDAPAAVLLVRLAVGFTFMVAGSSKLRDLSSTSGFFEGIGFPAPAELAAMVGTFELLGGMLVLLGLFTRIAVLPLIVIMIMAILSTKIPTLVGGPFGPFAAPRGPNTGLAAFLTASRLDFSMLMTTVFLLITGAGPTSVDAKLVQRR
ncbi:MAG TPA: DoxX family protein [Gemmatimonadaceae bacterium]